MPVPLPLVAPLAENLQVLHGVRPAPRVGDDVVEMYLVALRVYEFAVYLHKLIIAAEVTIKRKVRISEA